MLKLVSRRGAGVLICIFGVALRVADAPAAEIFVSSAADITTAMQNAHPGDVLVMANNGNWHNQSINFAGNNGTAAAAITLRAETAGQVKLTGTSNLSIGGNYLVVDGLNFEGGTPADGTSVIKFKGSNGVVANNSRVTNTQIKNYTAASETDRTFWVSLYGQNNRVDHSTFQGQNNSGVTVVAWLENGQAANHRIDSNYFADRPVGITNNGYETIRIGDSATSNTNAGVVVENNLFQKVDGEIEIISNKSNDNIYRYNTIRESAGTLTLRHGDRATVEGNFILGNNKDGSGGVRVVGQDHKIFNNYISNVDDRADGAISITAGVPDTPLNGYKQVTGLEISNNTIVNPKDAAVTFDWGLGSGDQSLLAENVSLKNNLFYTNLASASPLFEGTEGAGWIWQNNIAYGASLGPKQNEAGILNVDPQLAQGTDGLWRPTASSPAIDGGTTVSFTTDIDGQARIGVADIGADEYSVAQIVRKPLTANDVGTLWNSIVAPPTGSYFAVQAEEFTVVTDPNGDGRVWTTVADAAALGGFAIEAPSGSRTDLGTSPQDTLAVYLLTFAEAETYTAYYRARGFNGSSDSLFAPDDFNTDPALSESTTDNGLFRWEVGGTFEITTSNVGMPLEFRLGRREGLTQLDAIVFHVDSTLTSAQLDALFASSVPEPSKAMVLLLGLISVLQIRRRRAI